MLRMLVAIDGVGLLYALVVIFQRAGSSWPSTGLTRTVCLIGFSLYSGNFSIVACGPFFPGLEGLKALSCSTLLTSLTTGGLSLMFSQMSYIGPG